MAIPGIRGLDHVGFTVPDLEQAHEVAHRPELTRYNPTFLSHF